MSYISTKDKASIFEHAKNMSNFKPHVKKSWEYIHPGSPPPSARQGYSKMTIFTPKLAPITEEGSTRTLT